MLPFVHSTFHMVFDHLFRLLIEKHSLRIVHGRLLQLPSLPVDCCVPTITDVPARPGSASAEWANSSTSSERADSSRENHGDAFLQDLEGISMKQYVTNICQVSHLAMTAYLVSPVG